MTQSSDRQGGDGSETNPTLLRPGKNCWRASRAEQVGWCVDGEEYFTALNESVGKARREILIVGWDIDSRFRLKRDEQHPDLPGELCDLLQQLCEATNELHVYVLSWDFAMVYVLDREMLPARAFGWRSEERLQFRLDGNHAMGASHHQKTVVIDGALAFIGGFDITKCRWDSRAHRGDDARRVDPDGTRYPPFHDVQAVVSGEAAADLRDLVKQRWTDATGEALPDLDSPGDGAALWPDSVTVRARDAEVAIARTWTSADGNEQVREIRQLYLDMIAGARHSIYIENQYFTSESVCEALAGRLSEESGPEVVLVLPLETTGWLEHATMGFLRHHAITRLRDADRFDRLRVLTPVSDEPDGATIVVHSKLMIVDNCSARVGSANLSQRSMSLDTECDLVVENEAAASALCAELLAEHLGADVGAVADSLANSGLIACLDRFAGNPRRLAPLDTSTPDIDQELLEPVAQIADLEQPIVRAADDSADPGDVSSPASGWLFLAGVGLVIAFWAYWVTHSSDASLRPQALLSTLRGLASHPLAPLAVLPAFVAGSLVVAPVTGMIALCALLFDPWIASASALAGSLAATIVNHRLGSRFHKTLMSRVPDSITNKIQSMATASDIWTLASLRLIPIAPFTFVNLVVGASGIALGKFLVGTVLAMTPSIVLICLSVDRARAALSGEPLFDPWIAAGIAAAAIAVVAMRLWRNMAKQEVGSDHL